MNSNAWQLFKDLLGAAGMAISDDADSFVSALRIVRERLPNGWRVEYGYLSGVASEYVCVEVPELHIQILLADRWGETWDDTTQSSYVKFYADESFESYICTVMPGNDGGIELYGAAFGANDSDVEVPVPAIVYTLGMFLPSEARRRFFDIARVLGAW